MEAPQPSKLIVGVRVPSDALAKEPSMINYLFDVDGTLTPSRLPIDPEFKAFFIDWVQGKRVAFVTGSDAKKTIEQVGEDLWSQVISYQCGGNVIYKKGTKVYEMTWGQADGELPEYLEELLALSRYPHRFGTHIEKRKGLVNFSTVGRDCSQEERIKYLEWDNVHQERKWLCKAVMDRFPNVEASIGGQISIDIHPRGRHKGQVAYFLRKAGPLYFFGDKTYMGGNDYPLAARLLEPPHRVFQVDDPEDTKRILETL